MSIRNIRRLVGGTYQITSQFTWLPNPLLANVSPPTIVGTVAPANTVTAGAGTYSPATGLVRSYRWVQTEGALSVYRTGTGTSYTIPALSPTGTLTVIEDVTTSGQTISTYSVASTITVSGIAPTNSVLPAITGNKVVGGTLFIGGDTWTGTPTGFTIVWKKSGVTIAGETTRNYVVRVGDASISGTVAATNAFGTSSPATAPAVTIVTVTPVDNAWRRMPLYTAADAAAAALPNDREQVLLSANRSKSNPNLIIFGHDVGGVWVSIDGGATVQTLPNRGLGTYSVYSVAINPLDQMRWLCAAGNRQAATGVGIYSTDNAGLDWTSEHPWPTMGEPRNFMSRIAYQTPLTGSTVSNLRTYCVFDSASVYTGVQPAGTPGLATSPDSGATWTTVKSGTTFPAATYGTTIYGCKVDPSDPTTLFVWGSNGLMRIANAHLTTSTVVRQSGMNSLPGAGAVFSEPYLSADGEICIVAVAGSGIWKRTTRGGTWSSIYLWPQITHCAVNDVFPSVIYAWCRGGTFADRCRFTTNGTVAAPTFTTGTFTQHPGTTDRAVTANEPTVLPNPLVSGDALGVGSTYWFRTTNSGSTWLPAMGYFCGIHFKSYGGGQMFSPQLPRQLPFDLLDAGLMLSENGGVTFSDRRPRVGKCSSSVTAVHPDTRTWLVASGPGTRSSGMLSRTTDRGLTWAEVRSVDTGGRQWCGWDAGAKTAVLPTGGITAAATTFTVAANGADYPASGNIVVDDEVITYTRSGNVFTLTVRGVGASSPLDHLAGAIVYQDVQYAYQLNERSTDKGVTWAAMGGLPAFCCVVGVSKTAITGAGSIKHSVLYAADILTGGSFQNIHMSIDRGTAWTLVADTGYDLRSGIDFHALFRVHPTLPYILFTKAANGHLRRWDCSGAITSTEINVLGATPSGLQTTGVAIYDANPTIMAVRTNQIKTEQAVWESVDTGATWTNISDGIPNNTNGGGMEYHPITGDLYFDTTNGNWVRARSVGGLHADSTSGLLATTYLARNHSPHHGAPYLTPVVTVAPSFTSAPGIVVRSGGTANVGSILDATDAPASGVPAPTLTRAWYKAGSLIAGATGASYTVITGDLNAAITFRNGASNGILPNATSAASNTITPTSVGGTIVNVSNLADLQSAMTSGTSSGSQVRLASGNYGGTVTVSNKTWENRITIGPQDRNNPPVFTARGFDLTNCNNFMLDGLNFINAVLDSDGYPAGKNLDISDCLNGIVTDCLIRAGHEGLRADRTTNMEYRYLTVDRNGMDGLRLYGKQDNLWVHHCKLFNYNIDVSRIDANDRHPDIGMQGAVNGTETPPNKITFEDNFVDHDQPGHGFFLGNNATRPLNATPRGGDNRTLAQSGYKNVTVRRCYVRVNHVQGICLEGVDGALIEQNLLRKAVAAADRAPTVYFLWSKFANIVVSNNVTPAGRSVRTNDLGGAVNQVTISDGAGGPHVQSDTAVPTGWASTVVARHMAGPVALVGKDAER